MFKDERENNKDIYYAVSNNLDNPLWNIKDKKGINDNCVGEGPFVLKKFDNNEYYLYLDGFKLSTIYSGKVNIENEKLSTSITKDKALNNLPLRVRHFSILPITEKEHNNIINSYK